MEALNTTGKEYIVLKLDLSSMTSVEVLEAAKSVHNLTELPVSVIPTEASIEACSVTELQEHVSYLSAKLKQRLESEGEV